MYSQKVMDHFRSPRNVGEIENPDGVGEVGNPVCGDMMTFYVKIQDGRLSDVKFKTFGCGAAIAVSSMVSEMAIGKSITEALKITNAMVAEELGGLPANKLHCSNLGADALHRAIEDYQRRHPAAGDQGCRCPYCDTPTVSENTICTPCQVKLEPCPACGQPFARTARRCPNCGHEPNSSKLEPTKEKDHG